MNVAHEASAMAKHAASSAPKQWHDMPGVHADALCASGKGTTGPRILLSHNAASILCSSPSNVQPFVYGPACFSMHCRLEPTPTSNGMLDRSKGHKTTKQTTPTFISTAFFAISVCVKGRIVLQ